MTWIWVMWGLGVGLATDIPVETDLVARVQTDVLLPAAQQSYDRAAPALAAWPALGKLLEDSRKSLAHQTELVEHATGTQLTQKNGVLTLLLDLDADGGLVWSVIARGFAPSEKEDPDFTIDEHPAHRVNGTEICWALLDGALLIGNERGLTRQLRHLRSRATEAAKDHPLPLRAQRLRQKAPVLVAFELPDGIRAGLASRYPHIGPLAAAVRGGSLAVRATQTWVQLSADNDTGQEALEHSLRALVSLLRASTALLHGGAEALRGLDLLGAIPIGLPADTEPKALLELADDWLDGFRVNAKLSRRRGHAVEAALDVSSQRAVVAALGVLTVMLVPAPSSSHTEALALLQLLHRAQQSHHQRTSQWLSCGPVPKEAPTEPTTWPPGTCFDELGFAPPFKVRFQLVAGVEEGKLVLMARGDTNGDGIPEIWLLDETGEDLKPLLPPR